MASVIDLVPRSVSLRAYEGDPFDLRIVLTSDGQPVDVDGWDWAALIRAGGEEIPFEVTAHPDGVALYLRGAATSRLGSRRHWRFDVVGRAPDAGEGRTVLRGDITTAQRVTPPLLGQAGLVGALA